MAGEWEETTWGNLATLEYGRALRGYDDAPNAARVFGTNGPIGWHTEALWNGPGVIVGRKGAYRGVHYTDAPYWVIDTAYSLQPKRRLNVRWAYYQLRSIDLNNVDDGSPIPSTTRPAFYALPVLKPPLSEQNRIADLLGSLDDKIDLNRRMAATLEGMARAIFKSWFVDFDPVHAKAEGRPTGLPDDLAALFPDRFGADGLPEGWTMEPLLDHARLISGGTPKTDEPAYWGGPIDWASAKDVSQCGQSFLVGTERTITQRGLNESATRMIPALSTVVVARGATTGRHCMLAHAMAMNQTCYAISSIAERPFWTNCAFESLVERLIHAAHGSVFDTITTQTIQGATLAVASDKVLDQFEATVRPLFLRVLTTIQQSSALAALRDTLLPRLISGELRVADAEQRIAAA